MAGYVASNDKSTESEYDPDINMTISGTQKLETSELTVGARKPFHSGSGFVPFVEGGLAYINLKVSFNGNIGSTPAAFSDKDSAVGYWLGGGINVAVGERTIVGATLRYSAAEVTLSGDDYSAGGFHFGVNVGLGF